MHEFGGLDVSWNLVAIFERLECTMMLDKMEAIDLFFFSTNFVTSATLYFFFLLET